MDVGYYFMGVSYLFYDHCEALKMFVPKNELKNWEQNLKKTLQKLTDFIFLCVFNI